MDDTSPYAPPRHLGDSPLQPSAKLLDTLFFTINLAFAILFALACAISIVVADNPFAFLGGIMFVVPIGCYAIAEWVCSYRERDWLYRPLGIVNLIFSAFLVFGGVTNIGEALLDDEPVDPIFILLFGLGFALVAGYLGLCGWRRIRKITAEAPAK